MFHLDPSLLAPEIAALLISRGQGVPPLIWNTRPNRIAAKTLDDIQLPQLFDRPSVPNTQMASAARALLYFWNGWPAEALKEAELAHEPEKAFISALCARQAGDPNRAKECFQAVGEYSVFHALGQHAVQGLMGCPDPLLVRFQKAITLCEMWEPFLFVDLYEQARAEKLKDEVVQIICTLQGLEYEYLFQYCYESATGEKLVKKSAAQEVDTETNRQRTRELAEKHRAKAERHKKDRKEDTGATEAAKPAAPQTPVAPPTFVGGSPTHVGTPSVSGTPMHSPSVARPTANGPSLVISCPKCRSSVEMPVAMRGTRQACGRCGAAFLVPRAKAAISTPLPANLSPPPPGRLMLRCPKCADAVTLPESSRGKPERCPKCGAAFLVPRKKATASNSM